MVAALVVAACGKRMRWLLDLLAPFHLAPAGRCVRGSLACLGKCLAAAEAVEPAAGVAALLRFLLIRLCSNRHVRTGAASRLADIKGCRESGRQVGAGADHMPRAQISFGPISWLMVGEVFPLAVRGQASALATVTNFASNFGVRAAPLAPSSFHCQLYR